MGLTLTVWGLIIDAVGAFFLSVEAIKPQNLKRFVEDIARALHHGLLPGVYAGSKPKRLSLRPLAPAPMTEADWAAVRAARKPGEPIVLQAKLNWARRHPVLFELFHGVWGMALAAALYFAADTVLDGGAAQAFQATLLWVLQQHFLVAVAISIIAIPTIVFLVWALLGELGHQITMYSLAALVMFMQFLQTRCADGLVGVIGFLLLLIGFALQIAGAVLSA